LTSQRPPLPEPRTEDGPAPGLPLVTNPEQLDVGVAAHETSTGSTLAGMRVCRAFPHTKPRQRRRFWRIDRTQNKDVIEFYAHVASGGSAQRAK
jgi:hypothetical protein